MSGDMREVDRPDHPVAERGDWMLTTVLHPTGARYDPEKWLINLPPAPFFVVGYSMYSGFPIVMYGESDKAKLARSKIPKMADTPTVSGTGVGVKYTEISGGKFPGDYIPVATLYRQGLFVAIKHLVNNLNPTTHTSPLNLRPHDSAALSNTQEAIIQAISLGSPAPLPERFAKGSRYHPEHIALDDSQFFKMPIFRVDLDKIPHEVLVILSNFIRSNPRHLLYPTVLIQATLKYLFILKDPSKYIEDCAGPSKPVPHVTLEQFLIYYSHYESFHQIFQLAFYIHPFRWISNQILKNEALISTEGEPQPLTIPNFISTDRLANLLAPLAETPLGFVLPYAYPGSKIPNLNFAGYFSPANTQEFANACLSHWLTLGPPSQPLWRDMANKKLRKRGKRAADPFDQTRKIIIPYNWIQACFKDVMQWEATELPDLEDRLWDLECAVSLFAGHRLDGPVAGPAFVDLDEDGLVDPDPELDDWEDVRESLSTDRAHPACMGPDNHLPALSADVLALPPSQVLAPVHFAYLKHYFRRMFRVEQAHNRLPKNLRLSSMGLPYLEAKEPDMDSPVVSPVTSLAPIPELDTDESPVTILWEINSLSTAGGYIPSYFRTLAHELGRKRENHIVDRDALRELLWKSYCQHVEATFPVAIYISMLEDLDLRSVDPRTLEDWWKGKAGTGCVTLELLKQSCMIILDSEDPEKILLVEGIATALRLFPSAALKQLKDFRKKFIPDTSDNIYDQITEKSGTEEGHEKWLSLLNHLKSKFGVYEEIQDFDFCLKAHLEDLEVNRQLALEARLESDVEMEENPEE